MNHIYKNICLIILKIKVIVVFLGMFIHSYYSVTLFYFYVTFYFDISIVSIQFTLILVLL